uniref:Uncharacterized protein n=1 Tax=Seriola dumerili TaxID=41447 RepID=A0A3B4UMI0_SERDU
MRLARLEVVSLRAWWSMCPETVKIFKTRSTSLRPCLVLSSRITTTEYIPTPTTAAPPPASKTTPEMYMSLRAWPGFGMWLARARRSRTPPQINSESPVIKTTRRSDKPPLFSMSIRRRLRTQFMSCTAELSSCLSRTPRASRQRAVPAPSRHSLETLVVVERSPTPPSPQPKIRRTATHSTCSSRMLCPIQGLWGPSGGESYPGRHHHDVQVRIFQSLCHLPRATTSAATSFRAVAPYISSENQLRLELTANLQRK